jgi:hypothetical protein
LLLSLGVLALCLASAVSLWPGAHFRIGALHGAGKRQHLRAIVESSIRRSFCPFDDLFAGMQSGNAIGVQSVGLASLASGVMPTADSWRSFLL